MRNSTKRLMRRCEDAKMPLVGVTVSTADKPRMRLNLGETAISDASELSEDDILVPTVWSFSFIRFMIINARFQITFVTYWACTWVSPLWLRMDDGWCYSQASLLVFFFTFRTIYEIDPRSLLEDDKGTKVVLMTNSPCEVRAMIFFLHRCWLSREYG